MYTLQFNEPAEDWNHALPLGNGELGVMMFGSLEQETLAFNDGTFWSGYPHCDDPKDGNVHLKAVQDLIFAGKHKQADRYAEAHLCGGWSETFLPIGNLKLTFRNLPQAAYFRTLHLNTGVHTVEADGVLVQAFASYPHRVFVYRVEAKQPFSVTVQADSPIFSRTVVDDGLNLIGQAPDKIIPRGHGEENPVQYHQHKAMAFCMRTQVQADGDVQLGKDSIEIQNSRCVTLYVRTGTGYRGFDQMPETNPNTVMQSVKESMQTLPMDFDSLLTAHVQDFTALYDRQDVALCDEITESTDEVLKQARAGGNLAALSQLLYNLGKYMLIAGSRPGGQPMNLQGLWNKDVRPPWSSNYTTNINTQMNYWGASACGLDDCIEPLLQMMKEVRQTGAHTAETVMNSHGFCCHHNVDLWRKTSPSNGSARWIFAPLCGAWLTNELYAHVQNGALQTKRQDVYDLVQHNADFLLDFLVEHGGHYVVCPSTSPENAFRCGLSVASLDYATAYDMAIARKSLENARDCAPNAERREEICAVLDRLYPLKKGRYGVCEYHKNYWEFEPGHRHFSPLYAFYPARDISYYQDPKRTEWVRQLFWRRLNASHQYIGWSAVWAMCIAACLRDVPAEEKVIRKFITGATFDNLFCLHQPADFQIDGNLGFLAGIHEMLVTEENGVYECLPALLPDYKTGHVRSLRVAGASISFTWENGLVTSISADRPIRVYQKNLHDSVQTDAHIQLVPLP